MSANLRTSLAALMAAGAGDVTIASDAELQSITRHLLSLSPIDVASVEELDQFLASFQPYSVWRADEVAPIKLVDKDQDRFRNMSLNNVFRRVNVETSYQSPVGEVDPASALDSYLVVPRALGTFLPTATEAQAAYDLSREAANRIRLGLDLDRELRVWDLLTTAANWATAQKTTLDSSTKWNGGVNSNPILDLQARCRASFQPVTGIYFGEEVRDYFLAHAATRDYMRQMMGDNPVAPGDLAGMSTQELQRLLDFRLPGFPPFHIVGARVLDEDTGLVVPIMPNDVVLVSDLGSAEAGTGIRTLQTFRTKGSSGTGYVSREFFDDNRGLEGGRKLVAGHAEDVQFIANTVGGLIKDAVIS